MSEDKREYADAMYELLKRLVIGYNEYLEDFYPGNIVGEAEELLEVIDYIPPCEVTE